MGTGTYGQSNPTVINCGFKPKMVVFILSKFDATTIQNSRSLGSIEFCWGGNLTGWIAGVQSLNLSNYKNLFFSQTDTGLQFYCDGQDSAGDQNNASGQTYYYIAFG